MPRLRGPARLARRPPPGAGNPRHPAGHRPARRRPHRLHERRRPHRARRPRPRRGCRPQAAKHARPGAAHHRGAGGRARRHGPVRRHRPRPGRHPAIPPRRHRRRSPTARCTTGRTSPLAAPLHLLVPAKGRGDRPPHPRGRGALLRHRRPHSVTLRIAVDDLGVAHPAGPRPRLTIRRDGDAPESIARRAHRAGDRRRGAHPPRRAHVVVELQADPLPGEVSPINNRAVVTINGVRDRLRVLLVSGEPHAGRTHLAPPAEGRPVGRPGPLHHPAPAGTRRHDAAERVGADRLPGAGAVPGQDPRLRPDHPRPLPEPRHPAAGLPSQHRRLRPGRRRPAAQRRARVHGRLPASPPTRRWAACCRCAPPASSTAPFRPVVTALGARHPVTEGLPGWHAGTGGIPDWGSWYRHIVPRPPRMPPAPPNL